MNFYTSLVDVINRQVIDLSFVTISRSCNGTCLFVRAATFTLCVMGDTLHSSTYNSKLPSLALDNDITTCAETGYERGAWWAKVFSEPINVSAVEILGKMLCQTQTELHLYLYLRCSVN